VYKFTIETHVKQHIYLPENGQLDNVKRKFYEIREFPGVIGAIDCTHIKIKPPKAIADAYRNRKGFKSLNVQGVCDADGVFTYVNSMWPGSTHDSRIFKESSLYT